MSKRKKKNYETIFSKRRKHNSETFQTLSAFTESEIVKVFRTLVREFWCINDWCLANISEDLSYCERRQKDIYSCCCFIAYFAIPNYRGLEEDIARMQTIVERFYII